MFILFRRILLIMGLMFICTDEIKANQERLANTHSSIYVNDVVWAGVKDYLMPENHPMKEKLDRIFST